MDRRIYERHDEVVALAERLIRKTSTRRSALAHRRRHGSRTIATSRWPKRILAALRRVSTRTPRGERRASPRSACADLDPHDERARLGRSRAVAPVRRVQGQRSRELQATPARSRAQRRAGRRVAGVLRLRGLGRGGQGRRDPPHHGALDARDYRVVPIAAPTDEEQAHHYLWRFWRQLPRAGQIVHLRPQLVRARAGRARRGLRRRGRVAPRLRRDQRLRGAARRARHGALQVLAAHRPGRAAAPLPGAREDALQEVQDHRRGLPQPREVGRLRRGGRRDGGAHQHRPLRPGTWSRPTTSASRGSRSCARSATRCAPA